MGDLADRRSSCGNSTNIWHADWLAVLGTLQIRRIGCRSLLRRTIHRGLHSRILSTDSERTQFLTIQQPPGQTIVALNRNGRNRSSGPWYEASSPVKAATYAIAGLAEHNNGGAGRDNGLLLTSLVYFNGLHLKLECDDCGGGSPPDFDFNDKIVEVFFPLVYGTDFSQVILTPAPDRNMPTKITIA